jgi:hypothetical protein
VRSSVVRLLRFASIGICLIVLASFVTFAVERTKSASGRQQEAITGTPVTATANASTARPPAAVPSSSSSNEGAVHRTIDETAESLTSPFSSLASGSDSEWASRGVKLLAALLVYGFGLGYLARTLHVRL